MLGRPWLWPAAGKQWVLRRPVPTWPAPTWPAPARRSPRRGVRAGLTFPEHILPGRCYTQSV